MKGIAFLSGLISGLLTSGIMLPAVAQISSDGTTNTTVNSKGNNFDILNGIQKGNNLFHSFKEFSIPKGSSATFDNSTDVVNIINRVTGGNISNIDGLIKANGSANLFLINPAGIVFGENSRLDIGGSFFGSTAESILFEDGFEFSAVNPQNEPLLTVSVPLGLQMGTNPGDIAVSGNGHNQTYEINGLPFNRRNSTEGLKVSEGENISLVGSNISFDGGVLTAESGRIELGAVGKNNATLVNLNPSDSGWRLGYDQNTSLGNIQLTERSLIDASGSGSGSISLQASQVELLKGSTVLLQNTGPSAAGDIQINANEALILRGNSLARTAISQILAESLGNGKGADIAIETQQLKIQDGSTITSATYGFAHGGKVQVRATDKIELSGFAPNNPIFTSFLGSVNYGLAGASGDVSIVTNQLDLKDGSSVLALSRGVSKAGDVTVDATEFVKLSGINPLTQTVSNVSVFAFASGDAGNLRIDTEKVMVKNGAQITSSTLASGNAGDLTINASKFIEVEGKFIGFSSIFPSQILAASYLADANVRQALRLPPSPTGESGNLNINTPNLRVLNQGSVSVRNDGPSGNAGSLKVNADSILLDNQSSLTAIATEGEGGNIVLDAKTLDIRNESSILASTQSGTGGNIELNLQELLSMRNQSPINTESMGIGNGGNISINSPVILGLENSDIIANAVEGNGGNIKLTTQGIFGLESRDKLTEESDITASSEFGVNGTVAINNISIDPSSGLVELNLELADSSQQIASGCSSNTGNTFVSTGKGGIPQNPNEQVDANLTWSDIRDLSAYRKRNNITENTQISNQPAIVEATGFIRNENGEIELVATQNKPFTPEKIINCSGLNT